MKKGQGCTKHTILDKPIYVHVCILINGQGPVRLQDLEGFRSSFIMNCKHHLLLKGFLLLLAICFIQLGIMSVKKDIIASSSGPQPGKVFAKPHIETFLYTNRLSCSLEDAVLTRQHVPQNELEDIVKRRAEEYRQHQIRMEADIASLILAPANSPLQYPITGFTISPLKKSIVPGLALHAQQRKVYKVSLSVMSGVLSVEDVQDEQVEGQGQSELIISSSNLTQLNDLLSRVSYTSTVYHIKTSDLVIFSFEDHLAMFPITIKRQSVPVLFDPGNDINSQVTIITKTFLRYEELNILLNSIRKFYPKIKILIADDSIQPRTVSGDNIEHYIMPPAKGWFAGRNLALSQVETKYFLWVDDDFVFLKDTRIESFVEIMEAVPELDILGGSVIGDPPYFILEYDEGDEEEGGCLSRIYNQFHQPLPGFDDCVLVDGVVNYFLARTDAVRRVGFDPFLKRVAHSEFFMDGLGQLLVASCGRFPIGHQGHRFERKYIHYRTQTDTDERKKLSHHFFKNYLKYIKF